MAQYLIEEETLVELANSTRAITGEIETLTPGEINEQLELFNNEIIF